MSGYPTGAEYDPLAPWKEKSDWQYRTCYAEIWDNDGGESIQGEVEFYFMYNGIDDLDRVVISYDIKVKYPDGFINKASEESVMIDAKKAITDCFGFGTEVIFS